jgi:AcrR family transcriptional regulator
MAVEATSESPYGPRSFDLRERRRTRIRLMIQAEALRLFAERGYERTTVEDIAEAAAISPRTFFRYFPTKEDVVIWDEYDPRIPDLLESRPDDEPLAETLRTVVRQALGGLYRRDPGRLLSRLRLSATVPELQARFLAEQRNGIEVLSPVLARKRGGAADDLQLRVVGASLIAAVSVALDRWQKDGGRSDLLAVLDEATDALAVGMSELQPRRQIGEDEFKPSERTRRRR